MANEVIYLVGMSSKDLRLTVHKQYTLLDGQFKEHLIKDPNQVIVDISSNFEIWVKELAAESAAAQNLKVPITTLDKFKAGGPNVCSPITYNDLIFMLIEFSGKDGDEQRTTRPLGFIRVGYRNLYFDIDGQLKNVKNCFAALDFYVRSQRNGLGFLVFSQALKICSDRSPQAIAYDRPSPSMVSFLKKHFKLEPPRSHHNHYAIYDNSFKVDDSN